MVSSLWSGHHGHGCGFDFHSLSRQDLEGKKDEWYLFRRHIQEEIKHSISLDHRIFKVNKYDKKQ